MDHQKFILITSYYTEKVDRVAVGKKKKKTNENCFSPEREH